MIRILFGSALPILGLGAAVALLGPDMVTGPRGEPLTVAAPPASVHQASFDGAACASPLILYDEYELTDPARPAEALHVVTLAFRQDADGASLRVEDGATAPKADAALVLIFDDRGHIVAATHPPGLRERAQAYAADCIDDTAPAPAGI